MTDETDGKPESAPSPPGRSRLSGRSPLPPRSDARSDARPAARLPDRDAAEIRGGAAGPIGAAGGIAPVPAAAIVQATEQRQAVSTRQIQAALDRAAEALQALDGLSLDAADPAAARTVAVLRDEILNLRQDPGSWGEHSLVGRIRVERIDASIGMAVGGGKNGGSADAGKDDAKEPEFQSAAFQCYGDYRRAWALDESIPHRVLTIGLFAVCVAGSVVKIFGK